MSEEAYILRAQGVMKRFGGFVALHGVDFDLRPGERIGLIGPNGSGKSTFVNCLSGTVTLDGGRVIMAGENISNEPPWRRARAGLARSFQIPRPFSGMSVRDNIEIPLSFIRNLHSHAERRETAELILGRVGLQDKARQSPKRLTQVELRKLELARALAGSPKVLIADEVMAGLSDVEVDEIVDLLLQLNGDGIAIIMIEHIMRAVMAFAERIFVIVAGRKIAEGAPASVMSHPDVVQAYLGQ